VACTCWPDFTSPETTEAEPVSPRQNTNAQPEDAPPLRVVAGSGAESLDRIIHERQRLAIVSALAANPLLTFTELKQSLGMSDGNLSVHAQKLEAAGYISCTKTFDGRVPKTEYRLTPAGRVALNAYINHMETLINAVKKG
jgi:DNA-binding HxlR family transcriptional regulator